MRGWIGSAAAGVAAAAVITVVWWLGNKPPPAPVSELRVLAASPLCVSADGTPRPGSPTVEAAWQRAMGRTVARSAPVYHGDRSIELQDNRDGAALLVGFIRVDAHRWRPSQDPTTRAWVATICR